MANKTLEELIDYKYEYQCEHCGRAAFLLSEKPKIGDTLQSEYAVLPNGLPVVCGSVIKCGSCDKEQKSIHISNVKDNRMIKNTGILSSNRWK